jgi:hypothetical protein
MERRSSPTSVTETMEYSEAMLRVPLLKKEDGVSSSSKKEGQEIAMPPLYLLRGLRGLDSARLIDGDNKLENLVGDFLRRGSFVAVILWLFLLYIVYTVSPPECFERLEGIERDVNMAILVLLVVSNSMRLVQLVIRDSGTAFKKAGVLTGTATVQMVAMISNSLMLCVPTPVMIDPMTGIRSHMVRWAEWAVLAFLMTFLTESIDLPLQGGGTLMAWLHGAAIGLSTLCGAVFPFCTTWTSWISVFTISWVLFCSLFIRVYQRTKRLNGMTLGDTIEKREEYDRAKYSLKTITVCTAVWTLLAAAWSAVVLLPRRYAPPQDSIFASDALVLITESIFEVISKIWYATLLIEVHNKVFDHASRTVRRLEELRNFMSAVWDTSSDMMAMCSRSGNHISAIVSPAFFKLEQDSENPGDKPCLDKTMIVEVNLEDGSYNSVSIDLTEQITRPDAIKIMWSVARNNMGSGKSLRTIGEKNVGMVAEMVCEAFRCQSGDSVLMKDMYALNSSGIECKLQFEAKITQIGTAGLMLVLRDISERFKRFEAEKKLIEEVTARRKDAEANRFSRHEVKNGILAAIGLLDSLREGPQRHSLVDTISKASDAILTSEQDSVIYDECLGELDNTLRDILDTIMDHAMSKEVIYEEYEVRKERIQVPEVLSAIRRHTGTHSSRFSVVMEPKDFPTLGLDPRLLRYIYQNAVSNACRYGRLDGGIETFISYDADNKEFSMEVVNAPGPGHEKLLTLDQEEVRALVFSPGTSLHTKSEDEQSVTVVGSSGDGAWIMQKCARTLKGECGIRFEKDRTVFCFRCPARDYITIENEGEILISCDFSTLPEGTWGIVIDDSGIQRKLMDRFLKVAGIEVEKRLMVGKDAKEIYGFCDLVVNLMRENPNDKFLVIADENLEVVEGAALSGTVSGSLCLKKILEELKPSEERRLLALVRSANDSSTDIAKYIARAHGFLLKAPIDKQGVLGAIKPWWIKRFPEERKPAPLSSLSNVPKCAVNMENMESQDYDPFHDITTNLEVINALCRACDGISLKKRWRSIQDRLQRLKGDLKTIVRCENVSAGNDLEKISYAIDALRLGKFPEDLKERWTQLRLEIDIIIVRQIATDRLAEQLVRSTEKL